MADEQTPVTAKLIPPAMSALDDCAALLGLGRADIINRAVQLYAFVEMERVAGGSLAIVKADGRVQKFDLTT